MKTTLRQRLVILLVIFSIFFISIFAAIQVYNQLNQAINFNIFRARLSAFILRANMQNILMRAKENKWSKVELDRHINELINSLKAVGIIERVRVLKDKDIKKGDIEGQPIRSYVDEKKRAIQLTVLASENLGAVLYFGLGNINKALTEVYIPVIITVVVVIAANISLATLLSKTIIQPIGILNRVTRTIASGDLDRQVDIKTGDELEELSNTFNYMTVELKKMRLIAENANPLTKLPGNIVIAEQVEKRIREKQKFVVVYCDLDNFKAYNDKYGVEAGDKAIMLTANIFKEAVQKYGGEDDFIGHEGGDDFLILTTPERTDDITNYITGEFDKRISSLYRQEDLKRGCIEAKARNTDEILKFPIMTISLAGVTNLHREINSYAEITNIAAEVKHKVKLLQGSNFYMDKRKV